MLAELQLEPGLGLVLAGTSVLPIHCTNGPIPMRTPSSILSCFLSLLLLLLLVLMFVRTGAQCSVWVDWHGAFLLEGYMVMARRFLPVVKHCCLIPPWASQYIEAVVSPLRRWGLGQSPPGSATLG